MTRPPRVAPRQILDQNLFISELKMALRALVKAREMSDQAPADTLMDDVWDAVADLEDRSRKLIQAFEDGAAAAREEEQER